MVSCSVSLCFNKGSTKFKVPKDKVLCTIWLDFLRDSGKIVHENVEYKICEKHFHPSCVYHTPNRKLLKPGSVPTVLKREVNFKILSCAKFVITSQKNVNKNKLSGRIQNTFYESSKCS